MNRTPEFTYSSSSQIQSKILDSLKSNASNILSVSLNIIASHAGKINNNFVFYTPRSMIRGSETLTTPFSKHLQNLHRGDAVGVIDTAEFVDYVDKYSDNIARITEKINTANNPAELVAAVKELVTSKDYTSKDFKGLGALQVSAELYSDSLISELATGTNKGKVSIGGNSRQVYCSICSNLLTSNHTHIKGRSYNGETCFAIYDDMVLDHIGFVPDPADDTTQTTIVSTISDSIDKEDAYVSIENIKIQDNIQGNRVTMKLEDLKQKLKDDDSYLISLVEGLTEDQITALKDNFTSSRKSLRASGYLLPEKLLAINTKENVALAKLAIDTLEDSPEKEALKELLAVLVEKFFEKDEDVTEVLTNFGKVQDEPTPEIVPEVHTDGNGNTIEPVGTVVTSKEDHLNLSDEAIASIVTQVTQSIVEAMSPVQPIADSQKSEVLLDRVRQLETDIETIAAQNKELTNKNKEYIISQIMSRKGLENSDPYAEVLKERDVDSLNILLEDLEYDKSRIVKKEPEPVKEEPSKEPELAKVTIKDSIDNFSTVDTDQKSDLSKVGLAAYLKSLK